MASGPSGSGRAAVQLAVAPVSPATTSAGPAAEAEDEHALPLTLLGEPLTEAAVLGCVLRGGTALASDLLRRLTEQDWTVPEHAHVAAAAALLLEQGEPVDPVTVLGQLRRQGLENARTANRDAGVLLVELCQAAPCTSNARHYLRIVLEHSYRRRAQQAATRLLQAAEAESLAGLSAVIASEHAALVQHQHRIHAT